MNSSQHHVPFTFTLIQHTYTQDWLLLPPAGQFGAVHTHSNVY